MDEEELQKLFDRAMNRAMNRIGKRTVTRLKYWSSGSFSTEQLRALFDHPYATRHGNPKADPYIINVQEGGEVREGWYYEVDGFSIEAKNESEIYNRYLFDGTWKMFSRGGIEDRVAEEILDVSDSIIEDEIMKELNR